MITTYQPSRLATLTLRTLGVSALACVSLVAAAAVALTGIVALGVCTLLAAIGLIVWRPRYGIYMSLLLAVSFEPVEEDLSQYLGFITQTPISAATPAKMLVFSVIELLLLVTAVVVVVNSVVERRSLRGAQLQAPLIVFLVLMTASIGYGLATGGIFNIALWETRSLFAAGLVALLVPNVITKRGQVHTIINLMSVGVVLLSIDIIWRRFTLLADVDYLDTAFDHASPLFMNFAILLFLARLVWPASGKQRLAALLIPLILYAQMLTERRAGWVSLDIGLVLVAIFVFRLRRKVFFFVVLPLALVYAGYLVTFWNANGALAQPARAVRSINDPEGRDVASNVARMIERANVRMNVRAHPVTGLGWGKEYIFYFPGPDLSFWPLWHYIAHVQILWLWMKMGTLGFIVFLTLWGAAIVRGIQLLKLASHDRSAPYLVAIVSVLLMLLVFNYVDIGLTSIRTMTVMGFVLGVIGMWGRDAATVQESA